MIEVTLSKNSINSSVSDSNITRRRDLQTRSHSTGEGPCRSRRVS